MKFKLTTLTALLLSGLACGTETGNPEALPLTTNATSSEPARVQLGEGPAEPTLVVDTVWLRLSDVEVASCDGSFTGSVPALGLADHGGPEAALQTLQLQPISYCSLTTSLFTVAEPVDEPAPLEGSSLALTGRVGDRRFEIVSDRDHPITLTLPELELPVDGAWLLSFDVAVWLQASDFDSLVGDPVRIDALTRPEQMEDFEARIPAGVSLWLDTNGNGQVDADDSQLVP